MMKWAIYVIRCKDSEAGKDVYVGHLAYRRGELRMSLEERLLAHKQLAEERAGGFKLHQRIFEVGPESWEIEIADIARSSGEARELERVACNALRLDLNEWVRPS